MNFTEQHPAPEQTVLCTLARAQCDCGVYAVVIWNSFNGYCWSPALRCSKCHQNPVVIPDSLEYGAELSY